MKEPAYFDSQAAAAASLKVDIDMIREAKRAGCTAFRSGRVYWEPLVAWLNAAKQKTPEPPVKRKDRNPVQHASSILSEVELLLGGLRLNTATYPALAGEEAQQSFKLIRQEIAKLYPLIGDP